MNLRFLPQDVSRALKNLNENYLSEIRLKSGQPVIICFKGEYKYLGTFGICETAEAAIRIPSAAEILNDAMCGRVYEYAEQLKSAFITVEHGVRIGIAGEYVTVGKEIKSVNRVTSLNIRIPHKVVGCSDFLFERLFSDGLASVLVYSLPGLGKTTLLRDLTEKISGRFSANILLFDERNEIAAMDLSGNGFDLGDRVDVVRGADKLTAVRNAIRAMNPNVIVTDELGTETDFGAVAFAADCGIKVIASTHIRQRDKLCGLPFDYFAELVGIGKKPLIYDKNFNLICGDRLHDAGWRDAFGRQKEKDESI